ncbi:MAG: PHP-associated domain-containing protein, partial [Chloroflexota bacterium]
VNECSLQLRLSPGNLFKKEVVGNSHSNLAGQFPQHFPVRWAVGIGLAAAQNKAAQNLLFEDAAAIPHTAEEAAKHPIFELVDEVEVVNGGNIEQENRFAQEVTRVLGLSGTGGSDAHSVQGLGKGSTLFKGDIRNELDLLEALRAGEFVPVEGFHVGRPTYYGGNSNGGGSPWSTPT